MNRRRVVVVLVGLVACAHDPGISQTAAAWLSPQAQQIRAAATSGDRAAAQQRLTALRQTVADLRRTGELSAARAAKVLAASTDVETELAAATTPAPASTTVPSTGPNQTATTTTTPTNDENGKGNRGNKANKSAESND